MRALVFSECIYLASGPGSFLLSGFFIESIRSLTSTFLASASLFLLAYIALVMLSFIDLTSELSRSSLSAFSLIIFFGPLGLLIGGVFSTLIGITGSLEGSFGDL